ncbi:exported hypothetical protein [Candidatus Sulfopaludibacter sp. SbA4]|nr:exported hypothetical protein [Candidatus Sulfopaludibacter sp. SbA4]
MKAGMRFLVCFAAAGLAAAWADIVNSCPPHFMGFKSPNQPEFETLAEVILVSNPPYERGSYSPAKDEYQVFIRSASGENGILPQPEPLVDLTFNFGGNFQNALSFFNSSCARGLIVPVINLPSQSGSQTKSGETPRLTSPALSLSPQAAQGLVEADFNGDGNLDSAILNPPNATVTLSGPTGNQLSTSQFAISPTAYFVVAGDFNGDGKLDLAISDTGPSGQVNTQGSVWIYLGNGDGTFKPGRRFPVAGEAFGIAAADFNGDGKLDVAVSDFDHNVVWVLLGNGDGTLRTAVSYLVAEGPLSMVAADFNGDGRPDLAVHGDQAISVLLAKSDGTFQPAVNSPGGGLGPSGSNTGYLAFADFNNDGKMDLAAVYQLSNSMSLLLGNGDGSFEAPKNYVSGGSPTSLAVLPLKDGSFYLITLDANTGNLRFTPGPGDGTLQTPSIYPAGTFPWVAAATADLNGDGISDVIGYDGESILVQAVNSQGVPQAAASYPVPPDTLGLAGVIAMPLVAAGDLNNDGKPDIVVAEAEPAGGAGGILTVLLGKGGGALGPAQSYSAGNRAAGVVLADFNGDGKLDAAVINLADPSNPTDLGGVSVLIGNGDGSFKTPVSYTFGERPFWIAAGDLNGDGKPELVVITDTTAGFAYVGSATAGNVRILMNKGDGTFQAAGVTPLGSGGTAPVAVAIGDLNGDGKADLAVLVNQESSANPSSIQTLIGKGDGTFVTGPVTSGVPFDYCVSLADLNGDGFPDLILSNGEGAAYLLNNGDGSFQSGVPLWGGIDSVAAMDGSGRPYLLSLGAQGFTLLFDNFPTVGLAPQTATLGPSQSVQLTARTFFHSSAAVSWALNPQVGSISAGGCIRRRLRSPRRRRSPLPRPTVRASTTRPSP